MLQHYNTCRSSITNTLPCTICLISTLWGSGIFSSIEPQYPQNQYVSMIYPKLNLIFKIKNQNFLFENFT